MIKAFVRDGTHMAERSVDAASLPKDALWFDLVEPTREEEIAVETLVGAEIPTREDMGEIEVTSRLYSMDDADYMTLVLPYETAKGRRAFAPVTFIIASERLVTVRYSDPKSFPAFASKICRPHADHHRVVTSEGLTAAGNGQAKPPSTGRVIFVGLLETIVDRLADLLEGVAADLDGISRDIFSSSDQRPIATAAFKALLQRIGKAGELISHLRESLASIDRMLPFFQLTLDAGGTAKTARPRLKAISGDVQSLNDFVSFLSNKTSFLLDTTVGMISIEQNGIIKIFSVVSVGFMPPTLVASIYGMNFVNMPELGWRFGYPMAIALMVLSAVGPLLFFRLKRWL